MHKMTASASEEAQEQQQEQQVEMYYYIDQKKRKKRVNSSSSPQSGTSCYYAINLLLFAVLIISSNVQEVTSSRKFLTGLIIGTLLARNGQGQPYAAPPSYSAPHHHQQQQQPLFIIIPSSGKSNYKARPQIYSPPPITPTYDYGHAHYDGHRAARRLSPYLKRRSGSLLARRRRRRRPVSYLNTNALPIVRQNPAYSLESPPVESLGERRAPPRKPASSSDQQLEIYDQNKQQDSKLSWLKRQQQNGFGRYNITNATRKLTSRWPKLMRAERKLSSSSVNIGERPRRVLTRAGLETFVSFEDQTAAAAAQSRVERKMSPAPLQLQQQRPPAELLQPLFPNTRTKPTTNGRRRRQSPLKPTENNSTNLAPFELKVN